MQRRNENATQSKRTHGTVQHRMAKYGFGLLLTYAHLFNVTVCTVGPLTTVRTTVSTTATNEAMFHSTTLSGRLSSPSFDTST